MQQVTGEKIGTYYGDMAGMPFSGRLMNLPAIFSSVKKLRWDASQANLRFIFYTDIGEFAGPVIKKIEPSELSDENAPIRYLTTHQVSFHRDFNILNVLCVDLEHLEMVAPLGMSYPLSIKDGSPISFVFEIPYYILGKRKR